MDLFLFLALQFLFPLSKHLLHLLLRIKGLFFFVLSLFSVGFLLYSRLLRVLESLDFLSDPLLFSSCEWPLKHLGEDVDVVAVGNRD